MENLSGIRKNWIYFCRKTMKKVLSADRQDGTTKEIIGKGSRQDMARKALEPGMVINYRGRAGRI